MADVEIEYQKLSDAMSSVEKMERCVAMLAWTRQQMARQFRKMNPNLSDDQIK